MKGPLALALVTAWLAGCAEAGGPQSSAPVDAPGDKAIDAGHTVPSPDASSLLACTTSATCMTATSLAPINGDDGGSVTATGTQAAWYSVRASEDDSGPLADPMRVLTQLTSPSSSEMFDLFVYINTGTDALECTTPNGTPTTTGASESLDVQWGESGTFANGSDDSRTVTIEIRPKAGISCSPTAMWQLTVTGAE